MLENGEKVLVCCSSGESRAPSIVLMYLLHKNLIDKNDRFNSFKKIYPKYNPGKGMKTYVDNFNGIVK